MTWEKLGLEETLICWNCGLHPPLFTIFSSPYLLVCLQNHQWRCKISRTICWKSNWLCVTKQLSRWEKAILLLQICLYCFKATKTLSCCFMYRPSFNFQKNYAIHVLQVCLCWLSNWDHELLLFDSVVFTKFQIWGTKQVKVAADMSVLVKQLRPWDVAYWFSCIEQVPNSN